MVRALAVLSLQRVAGLKSAVVLLNIAVCV